MKPFNIGDLTIPVPIIQGGMGIGVSLSGLASAVANMGGVGIISCVGIGLIKKYDSPNVMKNHIQAIRDEIRTAREKSKGIIGVNIMSVLTNFSDMVRTTIEEGIDIIFSGAGLPLDLPKYLQNGIKTKLVPIVSSARAASIICNKWMQNFNYLPDAFVVEGPKAGGHLGFKPAHLQNAALKLEHLIVEVLQVTQLMQKKYNKHIPVIAAGGIYSGADAHEMMELGASGVQLGTRFVATEECDASPAFKKAFVAAREEDIHIIKSPVGMPGRALKSQFLAECSEGKRKPKACKYNCIRSCDPKTTSYCISEALLSAYKGNLEDGFVFTGANAGKIEKISTVDQVFQDLKNEYLEAQLKSQEKEKINK